MTSQTTPPVRARRALFGTFTATVITTAALLLSAPLAYAHDQLVDQHPSAGEVLEETPASIDLHFNNSLLDVGEGATVVRVHDADGTDVSEGTPELSGMTVSQPLEPLEDGAYRVIWRVVSSDGHPITGTFLFAVGPEGDAALASFPPLEGATPADDGASAGDDASSESRDGEEFWSGALIAVGIGLGVIVLGAVVGILLVRKTGRNDRPTEKR